MHRGAEASLASSSPVPPSLAVRLKSTTETQIEVSFGGVPPKARLHPMGWAQWANAANGATTLDDSLQRTTIYNTLHKTLWGAVGLA